ncbi:MAG TPA: succinylglutamate desuccinylase/aspartoacylase family protein, partial [Bacillota bacterium]
MSPGVSERVLRVGDVVALPGASARGHLPAGEYPDGTPVSLPVILVNGAAPGPCLLLTAGMHAPEVPGIEVIRILTREVLDPRRLGGAVIAAPLLNPWGFHQHSMLTPQDGYNLNRVFPGRPESLTSARLAHVIHEHLVRPADALVDLHANPLPALQFTIVKDVGDAEVLQRSLAMAQAYGVTTIQMQTAYEAHRVGTMVEVAAAAGKPGITVELVAWRRIEAEGVDSGVRGVLNVLKHLGMLDGAVERQTVPRLPEQRLTRLELTADRGGVIHPLVGVGEPIHQGQPIAQIRDLFGDVVDQLYSPR